MNIASLPTTPPELKSIGPYLQRAKEMERVDPVIAYWCSFHAAQTCMSIRSTAKESREFLMRLLDLLEQAKASLGDDDAITNNLAATAYVENFALKIFDSADDEDRAGLATRSTAQRFLAAACFLEVLQSLTNQPEPDILQKAKYAKWKATTISKALRDGQQPKPGPLTPDVPSSIPLPDSAGAQGPSGWPTDMAAHAPNQLPSPLPPTHPADPSAPPGPFPSTVFPPAQPSHPLASSAPVPVPVDGLPPHASVPGFPPHPSLRSPPEATTKTFYSTAPEPIGLPRPAPPDPIKIVEVQKHAKWAISALNFEDIGTARKELQIALDMLNSIG